MRRFALLFSLGLVLAMPVRGFAQNRVEQQIIAELRMLQEQNQQLKLLLNTLADSVKAISTRQDDQAASLRKTFADQKLQTDAINDSIRILREKGDDTNVRIATISHELESLGKAVQSLQSSVVQAMASAQPPAQTDPVAGGVVDPNAPTAPAAPGVNPAMVQSPKEMYEKAWGDYAAGKYDIAIPGFQGFLRTFPNSPNAYQAQYYIGQAYYSLGQYRPAMQAYREMIETYKTAPWLPDAYYKRGLCYRELSMKEQAKADFQMVIDKFPDNTLAPLAKAALEGIK